MIHIRSHVASVFLILFSSSLVCAQEQFSWIGKNVVTKYQYPVKVGDRQVDDGAHHVYTVTRVNGDWLWVTWQSIEGWLPLSQVVLFDQAVDFHTQEIRNDPRNPRGWGLRALIWQDKKDYDLAIADYSEAIRLLPGYASLYINRGIVWIDKKDYDRAIADFNEAIRLDPKRATAYNSRGLAWCNKKEFDKAITDCSEAIRLNPMYSQAFNNRGIAWGKKKEYDKAILDYNYTLRLDPKESRAYNNRGLAWGIKKEYDKAIRDYNEAIRLDPTFGTPFANRAWLRATCPDAEFRDANKGVESATRACELSDWKNADHLGTLAAAYAEAGDFDKAVKWQEKADKLYAEAEDKKEGEERLTLYRDKKPYRVKGD